MGINILKSAFLVISGVLLFMSVSCGSEENIDPGTGNGTENNAEPTSFLNINPDVEYQTIAGFGAADGIFRIGSYLTATEAELAFGTDEGQLGMSIFRVKLPYTESDWPTIATNALEAQQYLGVKILASPWSPPPAMKSNNNGTGGFLLRENFQAYADHINNYIAYMESQGVELYAISPQNEPDIQVSYESCDWSSGAMRDFLIDYGNNYINSRVAAAESFNFNQTYTNAILNDETAAAHMDIVAGHIYGGGLEPYPIAEASGKEIWMTEHLYNLNTGNANATPWNQRSDQDKWLESMQMLSDIHDAMTFNWNAYIWWYTKRYYSFIGDGTEGTSSNTVLKRGYAFSHYSRFIRPGYKRIETEFQSARDLNVTAYKGNNRIVIVMVNASGSPIGNIGLTLSDEVPEAAKFYRTSVSVDVEETDLEIEEGYLTFNMNSNTVATIVVDLQ